jgi:regulatory protein
MKRASREIAVQTALSLLSRAPQTRSGMRLKLLQRGLQEEAILGALDRVEELGYLDDAAFAEQWVLQRLARHPEGKARLAAALVRKGLARELVARTLDRLITREVEVQALTRAAARAPTRSPQKLFSRLVRLGFPRDLIRRHVPQADPWADGEGGQS